MREKHRTALPTYDLFEIGARTGRLRMRTIDCARLPGSKGKGIPSKKKRSLT
jgi:hypothetical protein